jgi:putative nucleotidyltransferase with HDIG domain
MKQVLFVDDESMILDGLKRLLRPVRDRWEMHFESSSEQALQRIEDQHFDVVVSDMRMPNFTGVDVLRHAKQHCPDAVRIGLSGYADSQLALEAAQVTHQFLAKPCDSAKLVSAVDHVVRLQERLSDANLQRNIGSLSALPSLPSLYMRISQEAAAPNGSVESVGRIVSQDLAITAKVLQLVNSAYFGLRSEVSSAIEATKILGLDAIRAIVITVELFATAEENVAVHDLQELWKHSFSTGALSRQAARELKLDRKNIDQAMLAGMLHDVGKLIEMSQIQQAYAQVQIVCAEQDISALEAEEQVLGCTHADIGAYLLTLWGFPSPVVEAVAYHHRPLQSLDTTATPLTAVHLADALLGGSGEEIASKLDKAYLERLGLPDDAQHWLSTLDMEVTKDAAGSHHG